MLHALLAASGVLAVILSAAWVREYRLRRGLQVILVRLFTERISPHGFSPSQVRSGSGGRDGYVVEPLAGPIPEAALAQRSGTRPFVEPHDRRDGGHGRRDRGRVR
jgi:hypothetical protein